MNFVYDSFSSNNNGFISIFETFRMPITTVIKSSFIKFNKLFTNRFFKSEIWMNLFQKWIKGFSCKSPNNLVFKPFGSFVEITKTAKSCFNPIKHWRFSIVQLKNNFINKIWSVFGFIFADSKITFSINKSSHINIIFFDWINRLNKFKFFNVIKRNQISFFMLILQFLNYSKFFIFGNFIKKRDKQFTFFFLLNKIWQNNLSKSIRIIAKFSKFINNLMVSILSTITSHCSLKNFSKIRNKNIISRTYNDICSKSFIKIGKIKTSVSINITTCIKYIFIIIHNLYSKVFKLLKQQFISDNPTEPTQADFEGVVQVLLANDGDYMTNMIGAENKFGTAPVGDAFFGLGHVDLLSSLRNVAGFIEKYQYPRDSGVSSAEFGSVSNIRFLLSSRGSVTTNASLLGADIYNLFIFAQQSYGIVRQSTETAQFIFKGPGEGGNDPINLRQTAGWRMKQVPRILNDAWVFNHRVTLI